ncbi:hypothetical protein Tco_0336307 [Tanacetum coccineum]
MSSTRTRRTIDRLCLHVDAEEHELGDLCEPANYKAVFLDPESDKWLNAMNVEMQSMKDNKVWDLVDLPPNGKTVRSKWLFKKKNDMDGLPPEVYALVSNHRVAKELWERIQLLMQGTSLTKQEKEFKLYDEFDMFAYKKGETLRDFYLRFSLLLNDMNINNVKLEQFQVNNKFLNTLLPE